MATFISNSPAETEQLGEAWGQIARPGLVVALTGDLGTGKTQLVRGFARGLGSRSRVHSPTFALLNIYADGRLPLFHLDLYRLENPDQVVGAGLEEYFRPTGVSVIEWAERWFGPGGPPANVDAREKPEPAQSVAECTGRPRLRRVWIEATGEIRRQIVYEDFSY